MKIGLIGYGKMGKTIEKIAIERGHTIGKIIDLNNQKDLETISPNDVDVVIEFTQPTSAYHNITSCLKNNVKVVSGTTGWLDKRDEVETLCKNNKGGFLYASNFSVGVNLFFKLNKILASIMAPHKDYGVTMEEIHHLQKKDAPSGTAITLAEGVLENYPSKDNWKLTTDSPEAQDIPIKALREPEVPGTHSIHYASEIDTIEIKHTAHSRHGFALGAVIAAEWLADKEGIFGMEDVLNL